MLRYQSGVCMRGGGRRGDVFGFLKAVGAVLILDMHPAMVVCWQM